MTSVKRIPWWEPSIGTKESQLVKKVLDSGFLNDGAVTTKVEQRLAQFLGVPYAVAVTSGTAALFLALKAYDIGPGDDVLIPDLTFIATANAVVLTGATPILVDIDPTTLTINPASIIQSITPKAKAIIPVHVSGRPADMQTIRTIARKHNLVIIEDAAEALGSLWNKQYLGTIGDAGCFSFTANKIITSGQGGAIVTKRSRIYKKLRELKDHGRATRGTGGNDLHASIGYNFKYTNLQAAILLGQFDHLKKRNALMRQIYQTYHAQLKNTPQIHLLPFQIQKGETPLWIDALVDDRDRLCDYLTSRHIECRKFWRPLHRQKPYRQADHRFSQSIRASRKALWLPSSFQLKKTDITYICHQIKNYYTSRKKR